MGIVYISKAPKKRGKGFTATGVIKKGGKVRIIQRRKGTRLSANPDLVILTRGEAKRLKRLL